ncbi:hypothetical protein Dsin_020813 [Dipteronia sinensis]|uniref:F-box domain-containing protein n=1 Tax=Dipteronia sinensis TaxID=43782 RepID=A0AAE0AAF9_9ROSI|nr:hypothetical protein Dsin_020813 [Dipteronia sinensis]
MSSWTADPEWLNWVELQPDVTAAIFSKLGEIEEWWTHIEIRWGRTTDPEWLNWVELQRDLTAAIFSKLSDIEVLTSVQHVCLAWLKICNDLFMWRTIDMHNLAVVFDMDLDYFKICRGAVDHSNDHLSRINIEYFFNDELLHYIGDQCRP